MVHGRITKVIILVLLLGCASAESQILSGVLSSQQAGQSFAPSLISSTMSSNTGPSSVLHCATVACAPTTFIGYEADPAYAGNTAVIVVTHGSGQTVSSVTNDKSDSISCPITGTDSGNTARITICIAKNLTVDARKYTATFSAATVNAHMEVHQFCNIDNTTPVDGSVFSGNNGSGTSITAGNLTGFAQSGDVLFQASFASGGYTGITGGTGWTPGSQSNITWSLASTDSHEGSASQWGVYNSTATINPTMGRAPTGGWVTAAIALKPAVAGTCTNSRYLAGVYHENIFNGDFSSPYHLQVQNHGNAMVAAFVAGNATLNSIGDSNNTWNQVGKCIQYPVGDLNTVCYFIATGMTPRSNDLTLTQSDYTKDATVIFYDLVNTDPTNPVVKLSGTFDDDDDAGTTLSTLLGWRPGVTSGLVIYAHGNSTNTAIGIASGMFDANNFGGEPADGPVPIDQNNAWAHVTVANDNALDFTINLTANATVSAWANGVLSLRAAGASDSTVPSYIQSWANSTSTSGTTVTVPFPGKTKAGSPVSSAAAVCYWNDTSRTFSVSDNINGAWTAGAGPTNGAGGLSGWRFQTFYKTSITSGITTVTGTMSGSAAAINRTCAIHEISVATALDQNPANRSANGTVTSNTTGTTTAANEYLLGSCVVGAALGTATSPWLMRERRTDANTGRDFGGNGTEDQSVTTTGTYTATFSGSDDVLCGIMTFK